MASNGAETRSSWAAVVSAIAAVAMVGFAVYELTKPDPIDPVPSIPDMEPSTLSAEVLSVADPAEVTSNLGYSGTPIAVEIRLISGEEGDGNIIALPVQAIDQDGRIVESELDPTYSGSFPWPAVEVPAGETRVGVLLFDIPNESTTLTLQLTDDVETVITRNG